MDDIKPSLSIDRLILDIPGLSPAQAEEFARNLTAELASATPGARSIPSLSMDLDEPVTAANLQSLATRIANSLMQQIG